MAAAILSISLGIAGFVFWSHLGAGKPIEVEGRMFISKPVDFLQTDAGDWFFLVDPPDFERRNDPSNPRYRVKGRYFRDDRFKADSGAGTAGNDPIIEVDSMERIR